MFLLVILWSLLFGGKHEDKRVKNLFPTVAVNFSSPLCPLSLSALLYGFTASSNNLESEELLESLISIPFGNFFFIAGGWLLSLCI